MISIKRKIFVSKTGTGMYVENPVDGLIPAVIEEFENGEKLLTVILGTEQIDFVNKTAAFVVEEFNFSPSTGKWAPNVTGKFKGQRIRLDNTTYTYMNGVVEPNPFEEVDNIDDPIRNDSGEITGYNKIRKLKEGLIGYYTFWELALAKQNIYSPLQAEAFMR